MLANGRTYATGAGLNDPGTGGGLNALTFTGNNIVATQGAIDSCVWHDYDYTQPNNPYDPANGNRPYGHCAPASTGGSAEGMQINGTVQMDCSQSSSPTDGFTVTNNSIVGVNSAQLSAAGTGGQSCRLANLTLVPHDNTVVGFNAQQNYLSSPHNLYLSSAASLNETITPTVTGNYCAGGSSFTQTDSTSCATSGFTTPPTCSFTLGTLSRVTVPFNSAAFTAQYGAVEWLASTLATTPTSGGQSGGSSWVYVPPVSLTPVSHGSTIYLWVMDGVNHISSCGSVYIP
jgi:hypothetical protein